MKMKLNIIATAAVLALGTAAPNLAQADQYHHYHGHTHYRHRCGGGNGAVGTVAGGVGGAVVGNAIGGGVLGTVAGGVGGALLGRHLDKAHTRHRNGC
jgi:outer membrane lipoprotein SlyB